MNVNLFWLIFKKLTALMGTEADNQQKTLNVLQFNIDYLGSATISRHFLFCARNEPEAMLAWAFGECRDNLRKH